MGLHESLAMKSSLLTAAGSPRYFGILNGLDTALWDPATDPDLAARYAAADLDGKAGCRADLLRRHGMDPDDHGPVLGMIGRLDPQKGFDLLADAGPALVGLGARIVVQGSGDARLADPFRALAAARPDAVALVERFDRANARRIYAGSDLFLMPSRFEPCGQGQMIGMRYGTPPIVRRTGGLGDTVIDEDELPGEGTGFVFDAASSDALVDACQRAFAIRGIDGTGRRWVDLIGRGMALDFGWETGAAPRYAAAYRDATDLRRSSMTSTPPGAARPG
jgi:starch synthase